MVLLMCSFALAAVYDPGHPASEVGGSTVADNTFSSSADYSFMTNVGIGTDSPLGKLHLALGEGLYFTDSQDYYGPNYDSRIIRMVDGNGNNASVDGGITFERYTSSDNVFRDVLTLRGNGNVGIGTINPSSVLEVAGDVKVEKNIKSSTGSVVVWIGS